MIATVRTSFKSVYRVSYRSLVIASLVTAALCNVGCQQENQSAADRAKSSTRDLAMDKALVGTWQKTTDEACAAKYPEILEFFESGVYTISAPEGEFRYWQSGDFQTENPSKVKIQTANDQMQEYEYSFDSNGSLVFVDDSDCTIVYIKVK